MSATPSQSPLDRLLLPRIESRLSFLYVERAVINRDGNALTIKDQRGIAHVPATQLAVVLLGPGTKVTYAAMALLGDAGASVVWVGEKGVRYYAHGRPPAKTSRFAEVHARLWSNQRTRLRCARRMYDMRFPGEEISQLSLAQLRGREGARMKKIYAAEAQRTGVVWTRRNYDPQDFGSGDPINRALTEGSAALYGIAHAVIVGLGFIPSLGIVHTGTDRAFVYDIADLYKAEISIPAAFEAVAAIPSGDDLNVRARIRDKVVSTRLMQRMVHDLQDLMEIPEEDAYSDVDLMLWSELEVIAAGVNWSTERF
ncbi:type I-E CRISPR-associated endonuclease Cas1e [Corynebacterium diphtheriae bv. mitis]|uniref:CRISPR-associated endonuclease Cas1 n=1 Tax=Corynebacterium diphtheriae TaxID=1717 RepID=A0A811G001_CORDP|nr:type I-E CRISPR-associated endonuclease Cas1e [Corynebacterium diphtheriae]MBG9342457.1 type I-E CRISPR-associated endonuclease Cas1 [Corynebacterium diphtheriae]MBG9358558.1 type I-E CRISPR-associated endonuclease Cas1 [Corynebacterium diphtheriae bv. mitis]MBG9360921.1 type I-E CRISPR-associated endonuclease Cas1 [Corynebacterium diphtheriae bv. mitis]MBG9363175.1 type I-E CRISPR-associated endonuclease Cas1 [Corynebacterium diphtheriae bv. mitis]MBG9365162.1 type I-E CRISPR-associated en